MLTGLRRSTETASAISWSDLLPSAQKRVQAERPLARIRSAIAEGVFSSVGERGAVLRGIRLEAGESLREVAFVRGPVLATSFRRSSRRRVMEVLESPQVHRVSRSRDSS